MQSACSPYAEARCPASLPPSHEQGLRQRGGRVDEFVEGGGDSSRHESGGTAGAVPAGKWRGCTSYGLTSSSRPKPPTVHPAIDRARRPLRFGPLAAYPAEPALRKGRCAPLSRFHPLTRAEPAGCVGARSDGRDADGLAVDGRDQAEASRPGWKERWRLRRVSFWVGTVLAMPAGAARPRRQHDGPRRG